VVCIDSLREHGTVVPSSTITAPLLVPPPKKKHAEHRPRSGVFLPSCLQTFHIAAYIFLIGLLLVPRFQSPRTVFLVNQNKRIYSRRFSLAQLLKVFMVCFYAAANDAAIKRRMCHDSTFRSFIKLIVKQRLGMSERNVPCTLSSSS